MIRLGAHIFDPPSDPAGLGDYHRRQGYTAAYWPDVPAAQTAAVVAAFLDAGVLIAEVGAWRNLLAPDPAERAANYAYVRDRLALADEVGALCCVDYLGTFAPGQAFGPHPDNFSRATFDLAADIIVRLIDDVRPTRTKFCLEMMPWTIPDSVDSYLALLETVDRPAFGVHVDPVNIITTPRAYYGTGKLIRDTMRRLGPWIASCHAKDVLAQADMVCHIDEAPPGQGVLDYGVYLRELNCLGRDVPLMLEHLPDTAAYAAAAAHIRRIAASAGVEIVR
jgi:sugar phosphate isomerase/epimerase